MDKKYIIAFDQGTTSTRAVLFNELGEVVAISQKELTQYYPNAGWVEQNPLEIYEDQKETFETVIKKANINPNEIAGIGITNQRETTVVWDKETGEPIYNAIVWLDNRTTAICEKLKSKGLENHVNETTGLRIESYFSVTKIKWILDNVVGAREKADAGKLRFGTIDSWLIYKFSKANNHVTDHTNASRTMCYDIVKLQWDDTILEALDIPKTMLPKVQASSSDFGVVAFQDVEIPIYGVAGDQQASLFGHGGFEAGIAKNTYGTGCFMLLNTGNEFIKSNNGLLTTLTASLADNAVNYALEGSVFIGGAAIKWLRDKLKIINSAKETEAICKSIPPLTDLYFVPAFSGLGAPHWQAKAKGAVYGLTLETGREALIKATVEALAYQSKDVLEAMLADSKQELKLLRVDGGASANDYLMQFQADIMQIAVERPKIIEVTALGVAFLAGIQAGLWTLENVNQLRKNDKAFQPIMDLKNCNEKYKGWQKAVKKTMS